MSDISLVIGATTARIGFRFRAVGYGMLPTYLGTYSLVMGNLGLELGR